MEPIDLLPRQDGEEIDIEQVCNLLRFGNVQQIQKTLATIQRSPEVRQTLTKRLSSLLREEPASLEGHMRWQALARFLRDLDETAHAQFLPAVLQNLQNVLRNLEKQIAEEDAKREQERKTDPLLNLLPRNTRRSSLSPRLEMQSRCLGVAYELLGLQTDSRCVSACNRVIAEMDEQVRKTEPEILQSAIRTGIEAARKGHQELDAKHAFESLRKLVTTLATFQELPLMEAPTGDHYLYREPRAGGTVSWKIAVDPGPTGLCTIRRADNQNMLLVLPYQDLMNALEENRLPKLTAQAEENYRQEHREEGVKALESYDIPRDEQSAYLRVLPKTFDSLVASSILTGGMTASTLERRYPNLRSYPMLFTDSPRDALMNSIREIRAEGRRHFVIDIFSHGMPEYLCFRERLTAQDLAAVMEEFPDCHFTFLTIACYGGGLSEGMQKIIANNPQLRSRVALFLQTRGNVGNLPTRGGVAVTDYTMHLLNALNNPATRTMGAAVRQADLATKSYLPVDSESIIRGIHVGSNESPDRPAA